MKKVLILGAAGRDFHNFNTFFRGNPDYQVVCFTAAQIPDIADRKYPPVLAGEGYPEGIPIYPEERLEEIIQKEGIEVVVMAYSDLPYNFVMSMSARVNATGADFWLMGPGHTMIKSKKPMIAVCAVRTGCGKSGVTRYIIKTLTDAGKKVIAIRHPMPYGDLVKKTWERYADYPDLDKYDTTIEEREEYEPIIDMGAVIYSGVDYGKILEEVEKENPDIIIWDGGNNDMSFYKPDLYITLVDPHRPGHEISYYPGEANVRMSDVAIIVKTGTADPKNIETVKDNTKKANPGVTIITGKTEITVDQELKGKKVLVVEDGPTITHGGMPTGAGFIAAQRQGAEMIDPRPFAIGSIKKVFEKFTHIGKVLPAMGYSARQLKELEETINNSDAEIVVSGTPIDLNRVIKINKPIARVKYDFDDVREELKKIVSDFASKC